MCYMAAPSCTLVAPETCWTRISHLRLADDWQHARFTLTASYKSYAIQRHQVMALQLITAGFSIYLCSKVTAIYRFARQNYTILARLCIE